MLLLFPVWANQPSVPLVPLDATVETVEATPRSDLPRAEVALEIRDENQEVGTIWRWQQVEFGPCVDAGTDPMQSRRWTWLSDRDALRVGVCGEEGTLEVRLMQTGRVPMPPVHRIVLTFESGELSLTETDGRWVGHEGAQVTQGTAGLPKEFQHQAEARYREVHEVLERLYDARDELSLYDDDDLLEELDDIGAWDAADWDMDFGLLDGFMSGDFFDRNLDDF